MDGKIGIFPLIKYFMGSSEPRYLNSLSQHCMVLSPTAIGLGPFLDLGPTCLGPLKRRPEREECKEQSAVVSSHV